MTGHPEVDKNCAVVNIMTGTFGQWQSVDCALTTAGAVCELSAGEWSSDLSGLKQTRYVQMYDI